MELEPEFVRTCVVFRITSDLCYSSFRLVNKSLTLSLLTLCVLHLVAAMGSFFRYGRHCESFGRESSEAQGETWKEK